MTDIAIGNIDHHPSPQKSMIRPAIKQIGNVTIRTITENILFGKYIFHSPLFAINPKINKSNAIAPHIGEFNAKQIIAVQIRQVNELSIIPPLPIQSD